MPLKTRTRDLILYVAIGFGIVIVGTLYAFLLPQHFWPHLTRTWYMFIVETGFLYFFVVKMYWHERTFLKIWLLLGLLFFIHLVGYWLLLSHFQEFSSAWFLIAGPGEVIVIATVVKLCLNVMPKSVKL